MSTTRSRKRPTRADSTVPLRLVGSPPADALKEVHYWADYVELRCLVSPDGALTREDLVGILRLDPEDSPEADSPEEDVAQSSDQDSSRVDESPDTDTDPGSRSAQNVDNRYRLAGEVFDLIETRFLLYEDAYPFDVGVESLSRRDDVDEMRRTYLFLLLCSLGRYVVQHGKLAKSFERLCAETLNNAMPGADVHVFGTAQKNGSKFSGNFLERARTLAAYLGEQLQPGASKIASSENGDRGLDVVAALDPGDNLSSRLVVFAQAATGRDWHTKQHSVSSKAWDSIVMVTAPAVTACLIPICFRDVAGEWHDPTLIHRSWILDRRRILHQARKRLELTRDVGWEDETSTLVIDRVLEYKFFE